MLPVALIYGIKAAIAGVAHAEPAAASAAYRHPLQQAEPFPGRPAKHLAIGPVRRQALTVGEETLPGDVAGMMAGNGDTPFLLRHRPADRANLSRRRDALVRLEASEHISARIGWIGQNAKHAGMGEAAPQQFAIPGAAIGAARKAKPDFVEALDNGVCGALFFEQLEHGPDGSLHFEVRIGHDPAAVVNEANRQWKAQFALLCLVELAPMQA